MTFLGIGQHSEQDIQSCSQEDQALHQRYGATCLMMDRYDCY